MTPPIDVQHEFLDAAKSWDWPRVEQFLEEDPRLINCQPLGRWSALHQAAANGNARVVSLLVSLGVSLDVTNSAGRTPMDIAATSEVRELLRAEAAARAQTARALAAARAQSQAVGATTKAGGKGDGKGGKEQQIQCMSCMSDLARDHSGIVCMNDHHICSECAPNFVNHVMSEGPSAIPVKCMDCHVDVVPSTFERNLPEAMQTPYAELCVLVGGNPEPGTRWHRCPFCPNMIIIIEGDGEMIYHCHNCSVASCMICSGKISSEDEMERHLMTCGAFGALRNEILDVTNVASQAQCPSCGHKGQKDGACTHMTCPSCNTRWCYVCGQEREQANGGEYEHNSNWETNPHRCPMWLNQIHMQNATWPQDPDDCVTHWHQRKIKYALRCKVENVGEERMREMLELFPAALAPFTLEEVVGAEEPRNF